MESTITKPSPFSSMEYKDNGVFQRHMSEMYVVMKNEAYTEPEKKKYYEQIKKSLFIDCQTWFDIFKDATWWREDDGLQ
jgi:hypothetical protein